MKRRIKILSSTIAAASLGVSIMTSAAIIESNININNSSVLVNTSTKNDSTSDLIPAQSNGQNANISTNAGPITFNGNVITALDWYGNKLWQKDMSTLVPVPNSGKDYGGSWRRAWFNWDYDRTNDILWVLGYGYLSNQQIFGFKASDGTEVYNQDLGYVGNGLNNQQSPYKFVTALSSGKVLIYGDPSKTYAGGGVLYDPKATSNKVQKLNGNSAKYLPNDDGNGHNTSTFKWYFYNLIPLTKGVNLAEFVAFDKTSGTTGDGSSSRASYNVYGLLVDDNLNFIGDKQSSDTFKSAVLLAQGVKGFRNTTITPKRDYFTLLNSQTVTVTYNNITLFDTSNPNNITFKQVKMANPKIIQTWTVDSNDNLYFKFLDDGVVYKVDGETLKSGSASLSPTTYLDLSGVKDEKVKNDSKNFVIYNVYGYTGQLMMIDALYNDTIDIYKNILPQINTNNTNWGLAIAVTTNKNQTTNGDLKGVLNGSNSIQQPADFTIDESVLKTKLPSEITQNDIKLENGAFFKNGDPKPFVISDINDSDGTFKVTANLYKIPWFAETLPDKSTPKVVTYTFDGKSGNKGPAEQIKNKVNWKQLNSSTDYDFMNMVPSNVTVADIDALNPFQPSFQSQTIMNDGKQIYPKTTYSIGAKDDSAGTIEVKVKYEYVPMSASYTDGNDKTYNFGSSSFIEKQVLTYTDTKTYTIFNKTQQSAFYFMGAANKSNDNDEVSIDVNNVPQLKSLLSAGTLPSSFESLNSSTDSTNSSFLQFIDTTNSKGYPISKMKFTVTPDDNAGTLSIKAEMPSQYSPDNNQHTYLVKYTGLNKTQSYSFKFDDPITINNVNKASILPSSVDEGDIIKNFITYTGFDSNDFNVVLTPNDENGTLNVQINLNKNYAEAIGNSSGFINYTINKTYNGFMTTDSYNSRFSVTFKGDDDTGLLNLKNIQANELTTAFTGDKPKGLEINGIKYTSLNQLVENLLVDKKGSSIPSDWTNDDSGVTTQVYVDNNLGLASFYVNIKQDEVPGASSDLNFVVTYSGFVKGNVVPTSDNLSFVSDTMLKNYLLTQGFSKDEVDQLTPTKFADWVNTNHNIEKLITYKTGEYVDKIQTHDYKITVTPSDIQGNVSITIDFGTMKNSQSLSEYSVQYTI